MLALSWLGERELDLIQPDSSSPGEVHSSGVYGTGKGGHAHVPMC